MRGLEGKTAVVTGGAQGIGRAIAIDLSKRGVHVAVIDIQPATETMQHLAELGNAGMYAQADVCDFDSFRDGARLVCDDLGEPDFVVNNAGGAKTSKATILEMSTDTWLAIMKLNLTAAFYAARIFCPAMVRRQSGAVVNIASTAARFVWPKSAHYNAAKAGVVALTRTLALEMRAAGVRANCVSPAQVDTPAWAGSRDRVVWQREAEATAVGRVTKPEDVARVVSFLLSDEARCLTGADVLCDGGYGLTGELFER